MRIRYICVSKTCRREVETETLFIPRCVCGSEMKKVYSAPVFTRLSEAEAAERFGEFAWAKIKMKRGA